MKCRIINTEEFIIMRCNSGDFDKVVHSKIVLEYDYCPFCGNRLVNPESYNTLTSKEAQK